MSREEELFEGIQIMTPEELEGSFSSEDELPANESAGEKEDETTVTSTENEITITSPGEPSGTEDSEEDDEDTPPSGTGDNSGTANAYSALIKDMIKEGVLTGPEGEELEELLKDASLDTVKKFMQTTVEESFKAKQENWKKSLDPTKKRFLEIEDAFDETDKAIQVAQRLEFFENLSEDAVRNDENLQKNIYFEYLKEKGFTDAEAIEAIEDASAVDKLQEKALKAIPSLKQNAESFVEESKRAKAAQLEELQQKNQQVFEKLIGSIESRETFVPGLQLNKIAKEKLKANITTPVYEDKQGKKYTSLMYKQMRNPTEFEMLINYYDTLGLFNIDKDGNFKPDISKFKNVAKTKAVSELDQVLKREAERGVGQHTSANVSGKTTGILDLLEKAYGGDKKKK